MKESKYAISGDFFHIDYGNCALCGSAFGGIMNGIIRIFDLNFLVFLNFFN